MQTLPDGRWRVERVLAAHKAQGGVVALVSVAHGGEAVARRDAALVLARRPAGHP